MNKVNVFIDMLKDTNGGASSKRGAFLYMMILFGIYFISNLYWGFAIKESLEDTFLTIILVVFGGIAGEKLLQGKKTVEIKDGDKSLTTTQNTEAPK